MTAAMPPRTLSPSLPKCRTVSGRSAGLLGMGHLLGGSGPEVLERQLVGLPDQTDLEVAHELRDLLLVVVHVFAVRGPPGDDDREDPRLDETDDAAHAGVRDDDVGAPGLRGEVGRGHLIVHRAPQAGWRLGHPELPDDLHVWRQDGGDTLHQPTELVGLDRTEGHEDATDLSVVAGPRHEITEHRAVVRPAPCRPAGVLVPGLEQPGAVHDAPGERRAVHPAHALDVEPW